MVYGSINLFLFLYQSFYNYCLVGKLIFFMVKVNFCVSVVRGIAFLEYCLISYQFKLFFRIVLFMLILYFMY